MSNDQRVSAEAWEGLVADLIELGPGPDGGDVIRAVVQRLYDTEGITLDEENREVSA